MAPTMTKMTQIVIVLMSALAADAAVDVTANTAVDAAVDAAYAADDVGGPGAAAAVYVPKSASAEQACDSCGALVQSNCVKQAKVSSASAVNKSENAKNCAACHCLAFLSHAISNTLPDGKPAPNDMELKWTFSCSTQIQARVFAANRAGCMCKNHEHVLTMGSVLKVSPGSATVCDSFAPQSASKFDASKYNWDKHVEDTTTAPPEKTTWMPENLKAVPIGGGR